MTDASVIFPAAGTARRGTLAFDAPVLTEAGYTCPYFAVNGRMPGPTLLVTAGIHGSEYPAIDAVVRLCREIDPTHLRGRVIALPLINTPAFWGRTAFCCPLDGKNLNRVFPGDPSGSFSEVLAHHLMSFVFAGVDALVDLHGGDLVEELTSFSIVQETGQAKIDERAYALARAFGLPYLAPLASTGAAITGTAIGAAAARGIPAMVAEAGGVGQVQPDAVAALLAGLWRVLRHLGMVVAGDSQGGRQMDVTVCREMAWVRCPESRYVRSRVRAGQRVEEGDAVADLCDLWGEPLGTIRSPTNGIVLFVTTSPAVVAGGVVAGIGVLS